MTNIREVPPELFDARKLVAHAIAERARWGLKFEAKDIDGGADALLNALIVLNQHGEDGAAIVAANRATGAAKARESKWKKDRDVAIESATAAEADLDELIEELEDSRVALRVALANSAALGLKNASDSVLS